MDNDHIDGNVDEYLGARRAERRYASWDYCFNYFQGVHTVTGPQSLVDGPARELSCLQLGFYLASWGMYRGSTDLLKHSLCRLMPVLDVIVGVDPSMWTLDLPRYRDGGIDLILDFHKQVRAALDRTATITLTTKIMLGVFGCVPAYDTQFRRGFTGATTFSSGSLGRIADFYDTHAAAIEGHRVPTINFATGAPSPSQRYTAAKVIDMIFFVEGGRPRAQRQDEP